MPLHTFVPANFMELPASGEITLQQFVDILGEEINALLVREGWHDLPGVTHDAEKLGPITIVGVSAEPVVRIPGCLHKYLVGRIGCNVTMENIRISEALRGYAILIDHLISMAASLGRPHMGADMHGASSAAARAGASLAVVPDRFSLDSFDVSKKMVPVVLTDVPDAGFLMSIHTAQGFSTQLRTLLSRMTRLSLEISAGAAGERFTSTQVEKQKQLTLEQVLCGLALAGDAVFLSQNTADASSSDEEVVHYRSGPVVPPSVPDPRIPQLVEQIGKQHEEIDELRVRLNVPVPAPVPDPRIPRLVEQIGKQHEEIDELRVRLNVPVPAPIPDPRIPQLEEEIRKQREELGRRQEELRVQQEELRRQQEGLGQHQEDLRRMVVVPPVSALHDPLLDHIPLLEQRVTRRQHEIDALTARITNGEARIIEISASNLALQWVTTCEQALIELEGEFGKFERKKASTPKQVVGVLGSTVLTVGLGVGGYFFGDQEVSTKLPDSLSPKGDAGIATRLVGKHMLPPIVERLGFVGGTASALVGGALAVGAICLIYVIMKRHQHSVRDQVVKDYMKQMSLFFCQLLKDFERDGQAEMGVKIAGNILRIIGGDRVSSALPGTSMRNNPGLVGEICSSLVFGIANFAPIRVKLPVEQSEGWLERIKGYLRHERDAEVTLPSPTAEERSLMMQVLAGQNSNVIAATIKALFTGENFVPAERTPLNIGATLYAALMAVVPRGAAGVVPVHIADGRAFHEQIQLRDDLDHGFDDVTSNKLKEIIRGLSQDERANFLFNLGEFIADRDRDHANPLWMQQYNAIVDIVAAVDIEDAALIPAAAGIVPAVRYSESARKAIKLSLEQDAARIGHPVPDTYITALIRVADPLPLVKLAWTEQRFENSIAAGAWIYTVAFNASLRSDDIAQAVIRGERTTEVDNRLIAIIRGLTLENRGFFLRDLGSFTTTRSNEAGAAGNDAEANLWSQQYEAFINAVLMVEENERVVAQASPVAGQASDAVTRALTSSLEKYGTDNVSIRGVQHFTKLIAHLVPEMGNLGQLIAAASKIDAQLKVRALNADVIRRARFGLFALVYDEIFAPRVPAIALDLQLQALVKYFIDNIVACNDAELVTQALGLITGKFTEIAAADLAVHICLLVEAKKVDRALSQLRNAADFAATRNMLFLQVCNDVLRNNLNHNDAAIASVDTVVGYFISNIVSSGNVAFVTHNFTELCDRLDAWVHRAHAQECVVDIAKKIDTALFYQFGGENAGINAHILRLFQLACTDVANHVAVDAIDKVAKYFIDNIIPSGNIELINSCFNLLRPLIFNPAYAARLFKTACSIDSKLRSLVDLPLDNAERRTIREALSVQVHGAIMAGAGTPAEKISQIIRYFDNNLFTRDKTLTYDALAHIHGEHPMRGHDRPVDLDVYTLDPTDVICQLFPSSLRTAEQATAHFTELMKAIADHHHIVPPSWVNAAGFFSRVAAPRPAAAASAAVDPHMPLLAAAAAVPPPAGPARSGDLHPVPDESMELSRRISVAYAARMVQIDQQPGFQNGSGAGVDRGYQEVKRVLTSIGIDWVSVVENVDAFSEKVQQATGLDSMVVSSRPIGGAL